MKTCKDCFEKKEDSEFYGMQGECKVCTKKRVKAREELLRQDPNWVEKEKKRGRAKYHRLYSDTKRQIDSEFKVVLLTEEEKKVRTRKSNAEFKIKFPEKRKAVLASQRMTKQDKSNHFHHWSYNQEHWKDIIELSIKCHNKAHRFIVYDQERMMYRRTDNNELLDTKERHLEWIMWCIAYKED